MPAINAKPTVAILDLEWNAAYSSRRQGYINEIIEFGAVKCGPDLEPIGTFTCFVRPQVGKHLSSLVADLTSITDEDLSEGGVPFMTAVGRFRRWLGDCVLMTWGQSDILALMDNCGYFSGNIHVPFLTRYCDLQRYAQDALELGSKEQAGLEKAAGLLGLDISELSQHRALDDSLIALRILREVRERRDLSPYIQACDEEFYRRMNFRTSYIKDLEDPRVRPEHLRFLCPKCGGRCARTSRWGQHNRAFLADFCCRGCGLRFSGRVIIKQKYEGLAVNKKAVPLPVIEKPRRSEPGGIGNMLLEINGGVGVLRFPALGGLRFVTHAFSTRIGGVSSKEFASMNLGYGRGDPEENVEENYRRFAAAAGFEPQGMVCGCQVHKTDIRRVGEKERGIGIWKTNDCDSADGLITDAPGVTLVVFAADCVPVYFIDPEHRAIGLAHAGWRGAAAGMPKVMAERMREEFGTDPRKLITAIGPSICKDCFEVDEPVAREFLALPGSQYFVTGPVELPGEGGTKYHVDLWECCRRSLLSAGVLPEHITVGGVCTMEESSLVFSHRKTRGHRGSNCAMLMINP
ncbi:peptidoglycan editing factor PgeF [Acutalibacter muris]|uniref:peptidoglycan editing factor PgeF n=1 Tax=Acutalibacter muris TaxID=1796620 RepID=UPI001C3ECC07|nr:peptidoglycan editing factor PgeF [Acutalibacter muris]